MKPYVTELQTAQTLAKEAGVIMREYFDGDQGVERKADGSPVTVADLKINQLVLDRLATAFPEDGVVGEEGSTERLDQERLWFCDPIDGTKAFTWGTPTAMFSLALVVGNEPVMGVTYDPFLDRLYHGIRGQGSYCNGQRLHVNDMELSQGTVVVTSKVAKLVSAPPLYAQRMVADKLDLASFSGCVYKSMLVAKGRMVGYVEEGAGTYDIAAADVIVGEAGGKVSGFGGAPFDYRKGFRGVVVSNGRVHEQLAGYTKP